MDLDQAHRIARERGVVGVLYWLVLALLRPFFRLFFRLDRIGIEHIPVEGPVLLAANHRSFSDPFFIGLCIRRRLHFVAKEELFDKRWKAHLLLALGAFPIQRGESDEQAMETARLILERGGAVGIFPEGTRVRPGPLAPPKRGLGRLALETGAPVVPVAIKGTEDIRRGWRIRPRRVRVRFGRALTFPRSVDGRVTPRLAKEVTSRVWSCIELQWEWLGGVAPIRNAAVIGGGSWGSAVAMLLAKSGVTVQLGCRTAEQAASIAKERRNERYLPGVRLPDTLLPTTSRDLDFAGIDLICIAVPSRDFRQAVELIAGRVPENVGILLLTKGLVAPDGRLPCDHVLASLGKRPLAVLGGPAHAVEACSGRAGLVVASRQPWFAAQLGRAFEHAGLVCERNDDPAGVQLAGCAKNAATLAAGIALRDGVNAAGLAAGRVYAECHALARARGTRSETFAGLAGAGDLVATVLAPHSRNRRAGELLGRGATVEEVERELGQAAEALDLAPLLASAIRGAGIRAPATTELAALVERRRAGSDAASEEDDAASARAA